MGWLIDILEWAFIVCAIAFASLGVIGVAVFVGYTLILYWSL